MLRLFLMNRLYFSISCWDAALLAWNGLITADNEDSCIYYAVDRGFIYIFYTVDCISTQLYGFSFCLGWYVFIKPSVLQSFFTNQVERTASSVLYINIEC